MAPAAAETVAAEMVMAAVVAAAVVVMKEAVMVASGKRTEIETQQSHRCNHESYSRSHCMRQRTAHERCGSLSRRMNVGLGNRQDLGDCVGK